MSTSMEGPRHRDEGPSRPSRRGARSEELSEHALTGGLVAAGLAGFAMVVASSWPALTGAGDPALLGADPSTRFSLTSGEASLEAPVEQRSVGEVRAQESQGDPLVDYRLGPEPALIRRLDTDPAAAAGTASLGGLVARGVGSTPAAGSFGASSVTADDVPGLDLSSPDLPGLPGTTDPGTTDPVPTDPGTTDPGEAGTGAPFSFQVATFNVLGSQHTRGSRRWASGTTRAARIPALMGDHGIDVIGFQEVQRDQLAVLQRSLPNHTVWPGTSLGRGGVRLQIAYRDDVFELAATGSVDTDFDHQRRPLPYVRLRERASGATFWVVDVHNSPRGQEADRDRATADEIGLITRLQSTGDPVVVVGDTNEKTEFFCRVGAATGLRAPNASTASSAGCHVPREHRRIDWVMGGDGSDATLAWTGFARLRGEYVRRTSDHPFVHATATITPR